MKVDESFFAIDGPNGVGKLTVIVQVKLQLSSLGLACTFTKEPTDSALGNFIRQHQNFYSGHTLAALIAADRYDHIEKLILPNVTAGTIVITDRYLASSFVYQVQDGLDYSFITNLNSEIILPSHYFILTASPQTIANRLASRKERSRFEADVLSNQETDLFQQAGELLKGMGVSVHFLENDDTASDETANIICDVILQNKIV